MGESFRQALLAANRPKYAIAYKLYCAEIALWLPLHGSRRWDGSMPKTDAYTLRPLELPLVPLRTTYQVGWVVPGNFTIESKVEIFIGFARPTRNREIDARLKMLRQHAANNMAAVEGGHEQEGADLDSSDES